MKQSIPTEGPITINVERDLRKNMRTISQRLNANPELAKLVLINPILVLEDIGVQLSVSDPGTTWVSIYSLGV